MTAWRIAPTACALVLAGCIGGCTVGPEYRRPAVELPPSWRAAPDLARPADPASAPWWRGLNDPELDRLMNSAARSNLDVAHATVLLRAARAERGIVAAAAQPAINLTASAARAHESANVPSATLGTPGETDNLFQTGFDASWEIDLFGAKRRRLEAAGAELDAAYEEREDVMQSVLAEVARDYFTLRGLQRQIAILKSDLAILQDEVGLARSRQGAGMGTDAEVAALEAEALDVVTAIESLEAAKGRTARRLDTLLAKSPGTLDAELREPRPMPHLSVPLPSALPSDLLRQRPDIRRAERRLAAATARIGVAQADWYPRFSLLGNLGVASAAMGKLADGSSRTWSVGPSLTWPILRAGQIAATVEVRDAEQQAALIDYRRAILAALADAEDALAGYAHERALHARLTEALAARQRIADSAQARYAAGLNDLRPVLAAQRTVVNARRTLANSEVALAIDLVAIHKAFGGAWDVGAQPSESASTLPECDAAKNKGGAPCTVLP